MSCSVTEAPVRPRESNFELLRCISMFMVLVLHANFFALGKPGPADLDAAASGTAFRWAVEALCICCVNVFVLISGWFGINASLRKVLRFVFQVLFFYTGGLIVALALGKVQSPLQAVADVFQLTSYDWFIKSYLVLFILSPLLNQFRNLDTGVQRAVILFFFGFEAVYGWIAGGVRFFVGGYGPLHLIGIYLLGQYLHQRTPAVKPAWGLLAYLLISMVIAASGLIDLKLNNGCRSNPILAYSSPLVVAASVFLFLAFARMDIRRSKFINWLGAGSFAVYLLHCVPIVREHLFVPVVQGINGAFPGPAGVLLIALFLVGIFISACLIDQVRIAVWNLISRRRG